MRHMWLSKWGAEVYVCKDESERYLDSTQAFLEQYLTCAHCGAAYSRLTPECCADHLSDQDRARLDRTSGHLTSHGKFILPRSADKAVKRKLCDIAKIESNRTRSREKARRRRGRLRDAGGRHTQADLLAILEQQEGRCYYCDTSFDTTSPELEHLTSVAGGGDQWPDNLAYACTPCNLAKGELSEAAFWKIQKCVLSPASFKRLQIRAAVGRKLKRELTNLHKKALREAAACTG